MTIPEFLTETRALGLQPPQAMERLGVRSLQGLNLREALESLRRGAPPDSGHTAHTASDATRSAPAAASASARATSAPPASGPATTARHGTPPAPVTRFDEEDDDADYDVTFSLGDDADMDDFAAGNTAEGYGAGDDADDDAGGTRLDDVPDFDAPASPAPASTASARRRMPAAGMPPSTADVGSASVSLSLRARAATLIEQLRATLPGGAALPNQLTAYTNLLVGQLDQARASALVRGLWRTAPERLGTEQLHALIRWAKEDDFAEEAPAVLAALAAERTSGASNPGNAGAEAGSAPRAATARAARPSGGGASARPTGRGGGH